MPTCLNLNCNNTVASFWSFCSKNCEVDFMPNVNNLGFNSSINNHLSLNYKLADYSASQQTPTESEEYLKKETAPSSPSNNASQIIPKSNRRNKIVQCDIDGCTSIQLACNLARHKRIRHKDKEVQCPFCPKVFKSTYLPSHLDTHSDEKKYHCKDDGCSESFKTRFTLYLHKKQKHASEAEYNRYNCNYCELKFWDKSHLETHRGLVHSGPSKSRPYECGVCGGNFIRNADLNKHKNLLNHWLDCEDAPLSKRPRNNK